MVRSLKLAGYLLPQHCQASYWLLSSLGPWGAHGQGPCFTLFPCDKWRNWGLVCCVAEAQMGYTVRSPGPCVQKGPGLGVNALVIVLKLLIIILSLNSVFPKWDGTMAHAWGPRASAHIQYSPLPPAGCPTLHGTLLLRQVPGRYLKEDPPGEYNPQVSGWCTLAALTIFWEVF